MLSIREAQERILDRIVPLAGERVCVTHACGRVLAEDVVATRELPPFDNSGMDGYAVRAGDLAGGKQVRLRLVGESRAGSAGLAAVGPRQAVRVFTGAPIPPGADTVIIQEVVRRDGGAIIVDRQPPRGANIRHAGEDVRLGACVLGRGTVVDPGAVGLACALGRTGLAVVARPRVAILATGDELREPDEALGPGQIIGSNSYAVAAQVTEAGGVPVLLGIARDDETSIRERVQRGLRCDLLLTLGGVSVGDYDLVRTVLEGLGWERVFWKVNMKPGKPLNVGWLAGVPVVGLPGNPASSMVTFELFVRPAVRRMAGYARVFRRRLMAPLLAAYDKDDAREHVVRCRVQPADGGAGLEPLSKQGSGMLTSMVGVQALAVIDGPGRVIPAGTRVSALLVSDETGTDAGASP